MKPDSNSTILQPPRETTVLGDDTYLIEMTDRLQRLRSLLSEQERKKD